MAKHLQKLELTWIGKGEEPKLEPRILIENPEYSYGDPRTENMLIHGDNLLALKALEQDYAGKIKCIYIDPPYNTGSAFDHYDDGVEHSTWLNLIKPRLNLLRNLLRDDGSIWISIDDNEYSYLRVLCDEIFGRNNFVATCIWQKKFSPQNDENFISANHDYVLVFAKDKLRLKLYLLPRKDEDSTFSNPDNDPRGDWSSGDMTSKTKAAGHSYPIITPSGITHYPPAGRQWAPSSSTYGKWLSENRIWFGKDGKNKPRIKQFLLEIQQGIVPMSIWLRDEVGDNQEAKREVNAFLNNEVFETPKPERLIHKIFKIGSGENDIVLDSFLGSGTSAAVAHKMGRKYIGIELGEHARTHCFPRMKQVVDGEQGGISKAVEWKGGGGFKFYTLAPSLIQKDKYGCDIINPEYNANMLAAAMAKQEGFHYLPHESIYWKQGNSSENDFIFTTTQFITVEMLDRLSEEMLSNESLLICCKGFKAECKSRRSNITIKKIPQMLYGRCEFGKDDYSLNIVNFPHDEAENNAVVDDLLTIEEPTIKLSKSKSSKKIEDDNQPTLF